MNDTKQSEQVEQLKEVTKRELPEKAKKAIDKKIKGVQKPFSK